MLKMLAVVALGGGLGAMARFGLAIWLNPTKLGLAWGTLMANLLGSLIMGMLLGWDHSRQLPEWCRLLITVGFCGALTTFSSFAAETLVLALRDRVGLAFVTIGLHLMGSLIAVALGYGLLRHWLQ